MRFLSKDEAWGLIANKSFVRDLTGVPVPTWADGQERVDAGPPASAENFLYFANDVVHWLPQNADRLFWLTQWGSGLPQPLEAFRAMRIGLGASSEMIESPACHFPAQPWASDELEVRHEDRPAGETLLGMLVLALLSDWDGWLFSTATNDAIEIWERNVFFLSNSPERRSKAMEIVARYQATKLV